jgi:hypothetical protein
MSDFSLHSDSVDVEQIMRRIRARIREKRGVDYTEEEVRQLASVKLERFLDPRSVRSDLLTHFRQRPSVPLPGLTPLNYAFEDGTMYESSRGLFGRMLHSIRRLLNPVLKLFFNPNPLVHVLHLQGQINANVAKQFDVIGERMVHRDELRDQLYFELLNNLVVEVTRLGIELKNSKMRLESLATRLDFDERRARALEGIVQYRVPTPMPGAETPSGTETRDTQAESDEDSRPARRRRRRRGRRRGGGFGSETAAAPASGEAPTTDPGDFAEEGDEGASVEGESAAESSDMSAFPDERESQSSEAERRAPEAQSAPEDTYGDAREARSTPAERPTPEAPRAPEDVRSEDPPTDRPPSDNRGSGDQ